MGLWKRIRNALMPGRLEQELRDEMESHREEMRAEGVPEGLLGQELRFREESRDIKTVVWLDCLRADVVFGLRQLVKHRVGTVTAVLSLALGIGATASTLQLIEAGFWRQMPVAKAQELYFLRYSTVTIDGKPRDMDIFRTPEQAELSRSANPDAELVMVGFADRQDVSFGGPTEVDRVTRQYVDARFFSFLGLQPELGRLFRVEEEAPQAEHHIAVISHEYWTRRFAQDRAVIGKKMHYGGATYQVVGVGAAEFTGTVVGSFTDVYLPMPTELQPGMQPAGRILLRLRDGVRPEALEAKLRTKFKQVREEASRAWAATAPKDFVRMYRNVHLNLLPAANGVSNFHRDFRTPLTVLAVTTLLLLGLACTSVANLLLAQSAARVREMGIRMAIGAGRRRLVQLLFVESGMLGLCGAGLGLLFSLWAGPTLLSAMNPPDNPMKLDLAFDWRMPLLGGLMAVLVTVVCGLLPVLRVSRMDPAWAIRGGRLSGRKLGTFQVLLGVQIAFCVVVCFVAVLMVATLRNLEQQKLGFSADSILLLETWAPQGRLEWKHWQQATNRLGTLPGVEKVGLSAWPVQTGNANIGDVRIGNKQLGLGGPFTFIAAPGWLDAMGIELVEGRDFKVGANEKVAIVNEQVRREFFEGKSPLGGTVSWDGTESRIVGVARDIRMRDIKENLRAILYFPFGDMREGVFALRLKDGVQERDLTRGLRELMAREFPQVQVGAIRSQKSLISTQMVRERLLAFVASFFALVALVLAAMGIYGVFSLTVEQRRKEIAIRMAIGEAWEATTLTVLGDGLVAAGLGLGGGLAGVIAAERLLRSLVFGVESTDVLVMVSTAAVVLAATVAGVIWPLGRALRTDPAMVLRAD